MSPLTRREFLRRSALGLAVIAAGCTRLPAATPAPTAAPLRTVIPPTATPKPVPSGRVIRARSDGFWQGSDLSAETLRRLLDASVAALTGLPDPGNAWAALFRPGERIAIKVNSTIHGCTHLALALAVAQRLQDTGIPAGNIILYDRRSDELRASGYPVNTSGTGLRCAGSDGAFWDGGWTLAGQPARLSAMLRDVDAVINLPVLKGFTFGGLSFALKNHYGTVEAPWSLHDDHFNAGVTGLNALAPIRERTRLIVGDILSRETTSDSTNYLVIGGDPCLLASFDPLAVDAFGLQIADQALTAKGLNTAAMRALAGGWLKEGARIKLGMGENLEIIEVS